MSDRVRGMRFLRFGYLVFTAAVVVRLILLLGPFDNLRHGSAAIYGSAALGYYNGQGLTVREDEYKPINDLPSNIRGDIRDLHIPGERQPQVEFLPGPALVLGLAWKIIPWYNFLPLLVLQLLAESALTAMVCVQVRRRWSRTAVVLAAVMVLNVLVIKRVLMVGYDFWPQFAVLAFVTGLARLLPGDRGVLAWLGLGAVMGAVCWFREITTFLPLWSAPFLLVALVRVRGLGRGGALVRVAALVAPVILSLLLLSVYRTDLTGNARPTRSAFWHTFFAGVGQFNNPYGLINDDQSVLAFGRRLEPELRDHRVGDMWSDPNGLYEVTLKREALVFLREYPELMLRNTVYRIGIMIAPPLYPVGDRLPVALSLAAKLAGAMLIPLWFLGLWTIRKQDDYWFWILAAVQTYFFAAFGWFYVLGRVILPFIFLTFLAYLVGASRLYAMAAARIRFLPCP